VPKPVQLRASYRADGAYLLRLISAIEKDDRQGVKWREETKAMTLALAQRLIAVKDDDTANTQKKPAAASVASAKTK
jgi:hypothetical protein